MAEIQPATADDVSSQAAGTLPTFPSEWMLDCQFVQENAAGLALGALAPDEQVRVTQHLSWCPTCARLVHETRKTVSYLPYISSQAMPPASAKTGLFDRIKAEQLSGSVQRLDPAFRAFAIPASGIGAFAAPSGRTATIAMLHAPKRSHDGKRHFRWEVIAAPLAAVPLIVALAIVGGWAFHTQGQLSNQQERNQTLSLANQALLDENTALNNIVGGEQATYTLSPSQEETGNSAGGKLLATRGADQFQASLQVWDLPTSRNGYEVVFETQNGTLHSVVNFAVDGSGSASLNFNVGSPLALFRAIYVQSAASDENVSTSDSITPADVLWTDMQSNLGGSGGTEANAKAK